MRERKKNEYNPSVLQKDIRMRERKKNEYNPSVLQKDMRTREGVE